MPAISSPQTPTPTDLGALVRRFRLQAGLSTRELARRANVAASYVSKVELGERREPLDFCERLTEVLPLSRADRELLRALITLHRVEATPLMHGHILQKAQTALERLERSAETIKVLQLSVIPALLQTEAYMTAIFRRLDPQAPRNAIMRERIRRQRVLESRRASLQFVIADWALTAGWSSARAMAAQRARLATLASRPNIDIRILLAGAAFPSAASPLPCGFEVVDDALVVVDTLAGFTTVRTPEGVAAHVRGFSDALAAAIPLRVFCVR